MKKIFSLTLVATLLSAAAFAQLGPISGTLSCCTGSTGYVYDSLSPGGTWSVSNTSIATMNPTSGIVYGVSAGQTIITYTLGGSYVTDTFDVFTAPGPITGTMHMCPGASAALTDAVSGGFWYSSNNSIATVTGGGLVYGVSPGTVYIYYSTGGSCHATAMDTINGTTTPMVTGPYTVCMGSTIALTDSTGTGGSSGGVWSSSNASVATVNGTSGVVTGVSVGTAIITYAVTGTCGTVYGTHTVSVINTTTPASLSGSSTVSVGSTTTISPSVSGGTWSSGSPSVATVSSGGVVTGVAAGTDVITYTITGCGGSASSTFTVTVTPFDGISGHVLFSGTAYYGPVKVWLITYNPATLDLEAMDSLSVYCSGSSSVYYQFPGVATDSYRVKAAAYDSLVSGATTGYIPTYHNSSFYWYSANVIAHTSGTSDINEDINMMTGTPTSGPGFIGGSVLTGANKGTSVTGIPVVGLKMYLLNSSDQLIQAVRTDASGSYSFSNLPVGMYYVFPDSLNYLTTAYTGITLTASAASMSTAGFTQHTLSKTITPNTTAVSNISNMASSVFAFPNPTNGRLNLQWNVKTTEAATVTVSDITGREVYHTGINMAQGTGTTQLNLSDLVNGLYMVTVKAASVNYNTKIQVQH